MVPTQLHAPERLGSLVCWYHGVLRTSQGSSKHVLFPLQPLAERFRNTCGVDPAYVANFGEEVARGQPVFIMSQLLKALEPMLRESAEVAPWQVCCLWQGSHISIFCTQLLPSLWPATWAVQTAKAGMRRAALA